MPFAMLFQNLTNLMKKSNWSTKQPCCQRNCVDDKRCYGDILSLRFFFSFIPLITNTIMVPRMSRWRYVVIVVQWNPTSVTPLFKGYPHLRDNTVWSQIFSGFSNVKKPLFKGYSDLRDKFLKISLISGEILSKFDGFWKNLDFEIIFSKKFIAK